MNRILIVAIALVLAAPAWLAQAPSEERPWNQSSGDAYKTNVVDLDGHQLDILAYARVVEDGEVLAGTGGPGFLPTIHGAEFMLWKLEDAGASTCTLGRLLHDLNIERLHEWPCQAPSKLLAYDAKLDALLVCHSQGDGRPLLDLLHGPSRESIGSIHISDVSFNAPWPTVTCSNAAFRDGTAIVGVYPRTQELRVQSPPDDGLPVQFADETDRYRVPEPAHILVVEMEGMQLLQDAPIPHDVLATMLYGEPFDPFVPGTDLDGRFYEPWQITWTENGLVVVGTHAQFGRILMWFHGTEPPIWRHAMLEAYPHHQSALVTDSGLPPALVPPAASYVAPGEGGRAAWFAAGEVFIIDPAAGIVIDSFVVGQSTGILVTTLAGIARWNGVLFLDGADDAGIMAVDLTSGQMNWGPERLATGVSGPLVVLPSAGLLASVDVGATPAIALADIENGLASGLLELQWDDDRVGTRANTGYNNGQPAAGVIPWQDGGIVWDVSGPVAILGEAEVDRRPELTLSSSFPGPGEEVTLQAVMPTGANDALTIAWGDGTISAPTTATQNHKYLNPGEHTIRATATFEDGTTATTIMTVNVGGTPPPSWVVQQFRDSPDASWALVGLVVTLFGAAIAVTRLRRRRSRTRDELLGIEAASKRAGANGVQLAAALNERRAHVRGLLLDGRIDESQLKILEDRIDELARGGRMESLQGRFDFLPYGFVRQVQEMLSDGRLSGWEHDQLGKVLAADESLTATQKKWVRGLLSDWAKEDA